MDKEQCNLIVLAALLHDIGKLLERGGFFSEVRKDEFYLSMCPEARDGPYHTHLHAAHTRRFCDWLEERFGCLREIGDKSWKDWCGAHHRNDETGLEATVIRLADRLSSSERDEGQYYQRGIHLKTRLEPVLERVNLGGNPENLSTSYRYPLRPQGMDREDLFPRSHGELGLAEQKGSEGSVDPGQWTHLVAKQSLQQDYERLCEGLLDDLEALAGKKTEVSLEQLLSSLDFLLEKYTVTVPSATNVRHPDIALYDHLRTSAAIAQGLFLQQQNTGGSTRGIEDKTDAKWLLVCGDFSGIQKFIYNLTNKGAAKGLRGRSFYVQYFCILCAEYILRELNLSKAGLLYNSGGKFYLLLPGYLRNELFSVRDRINEWLLKTFEGSVYFGLGLARVTADMFEQGGMHTAWKDCAEDLERDRLQKFSNLLSNDFFAPQTESNPSQSCKVCGSRQVDGSETCRTCELLQELGLWLRQTQAILNIWGDQKEFERIRDQLKLEQVLSFPVFGVSSVFVPDNRLLELSNLAITDGDCLFLNKYAVQSLQDLALPRSGIRGMFLGKWESDRQVDENGKPWDFDQYARNSKGFERMGILRMDVDNLGLVFIRGLHFPERETENGLKGWGGVKRNEKGDIVQRSMASMSRMVTLSRQLSLFFSAYVPTLLQNERFNRCQIIYAGGDDLFIIGSWDQLPELAWQIRNDFSAFCCHNPDFTISGGLFLQRGKYPIYKGALLAEEAEKKGKNIRKKWKQGREEYQKDGFCFQQTPIVWEDMDLAWKIKLLLEEQFSDNKGLLGYLSTMTTWNTNRVRAITLSGRFKESEAWEKIRYEAWRWRTAYQLKRRYPKPDYEPVRTQWAELLFNNSMQGRESSLPVISWLEFPLRWTEYFNRDKGGR